MSTITPQVENPIPQQGFERIRDRIAEILLCEIANQATLQVGVIQQILQNFNLFSERWVPLGKEELFSAELFYFSSDYGSSDPRSRRASNVYYIDCKGRGLYSDIGGGLIQDGDEQSAINTQRVVGIITSILEHPAWECLGFPAPFISSTRVVSVKRTEERETQDANSVLMYRIIFEVDANEVNQELGARDLFESDTTVRIDLTEQGFKYIVPA